jgi:hypothetical protein
LPLAPEAQLGKARRCPSLLNTEKYISSPKLMLNQVSVTPYPVPVNRSVTITVQAVDMSTNYPVAGQVIVDGTVIGNTNAPINYTFKAKRKLVSTNPREWEIIYPSGEVAATGYPKVEIDFGFP